MTLNINGYEVSINAKINGKNNKKETQYFLNELAIVYGESADERKRLGLNATAKSFEETGRFLHQILEEQGFYKDVDEKLRG